MKTKKYVLTNSYFKNKGYGMPDTILEIAQYQKNKNELPFEYSGNNWVYDAFCERQKRKGVYNSQYLTPDFTVERMLHFTGKYFESDYVCDACCGTGQITKELLKDKYNVIAFDIDYEMVETCKILYPDLLIFQSDFHGLQGNFNQIIANPPYETPILIDFLEWIDSVQGTGGISILLIPTGFIHKNKPKKLVEILHRFSIVEIESMKEDFERTKIKAEIVIIRKL